LRSADQEIADLSGRRANLYGRLGRFTSSPEVEATYNQLAQERNVLQEEHRKLRDKLSQASLAQVVESEQKGQILTLIDPAREPTSPVEPNRPMLLLLGTVLGLFAAFGSASLADAADVKVRGSRDVEALLNLTPMAAIPYIDVPGEIQRRTTQRIAVAIGAAVLCIGLVALLLMR
jgi:uncharacterized protein involved in exopolysaccharide biosynthesis